MGVGGQHLLEQGRLLGLIRYVVTGLKLTIHVFSFCLK